MARPGPGNHEYRWGYRNGGTANGDGDGTHRDDVSEADSKLSGSALVDSCLRILQDRGFDHDPYADDEDEDDDDPNDDDFAMIGRDDFGPAWERELRDARDVSDFQMTSRLVQEMGNRGGADRNRRFDDRYADSSTGRFYPPPPAPDAPAAAGGGGGGAGGGYGANLPPDLARPVRMDRGEPPPGVVEREPNGGPRLANGGDRYGGDDDVDDDVDPPYHDHPAYYDRYSYPDDPTTPVKKKYTYDAEPRSYRRNDDDDDSIRKPSISSYEDHSSDWSDDYGRGGGGGGGGHYSRRGGDKERRYPYHEKEEQELDLPEIIDLLASDDYLKVTNAAGLLQHMSYKDDEMKSQIKNEGAIPVLIDLLGSRHMEVCHAVAGVLRNLCYGSTNNENKLAVRDAGGITALVHLLKTTRSIEVKELVCSVLWNISSFEGLKEDLLQESLHVLTHYVIRPESGIQASFQLTSRVAGELNNTLLLRNATGVFRNLSSASENARKAMRISPGLVDALFFVILSAENTPDVDSKTVENCVCILRNLSFRLENEVTLDLADQVLDESWEKAHMEERSQYEADRRRKDKSGKSSTGCFGQKKQSRKRTTYKDRGRISSQIDQCGFGDSPPWTDSVPSHPRHHEPVHGQSMLWQPEVTYPYLMLLKDSSNNMTLEAAAGALQNLSAANWKWSAFIRSAVRKERGLPILIELLQLPQDTVVRSVATALRNMAVDPRNKELIGKYGMRRLVCLLPGTRSQSSDFTVLTISAVLCSILELVTRNAENALSLKDASGIPRVVSLAKSRQSYPIKLVQTANQICVTLNNFKETRMTLKREGWNINDFQSSALDQTDGMAVAAAATVGSQQPADAQYLRRHGSTYSQHKELKPYREKAKQRAVEARGEAAQRPVKGDFHDIDVDEVTRGGGVGGPAAAAAAAAAARYNKGNDAVDFPGMREGYEARQGRPKRPAPRQPRHAPPPPPPPPPQDEYGDEYYRQDRRHDREVMRDPDDRYRGGEYRSRRYDDGGYELDDGGQYDDRGRDFYDDRYNDGGDELDGDRGSPVEEDSWV